MAKFYQNREGKIIQLNISSRNGIVGSDGQDGKNATIDIGNVETLEPTDNAYVNNVGTNTDAILDFGLPRGISGIDAQSKGIGIYNFDGKETIVGMWNGKKVYRKCFEIDKTYSSNSVIDPTPMYEEIINSGGWCKISGSEYVNIIYPFPYNGTSTTSRFRLNKNTLDIQVSNITIIKLKVWIEFTKTDEYDNEEITGNLAYNDTYSEEERIVGTWLDGRPVYQKTLTLGAAPSSGSAVYTNTDIDILTHYRGTMYYDNYWYPLHLANATASSSTSHYLHFVFMTTTHTLNVSYKDYKYTKAYVTIQYVKISDLPEAEQLKLKQNEAIPLPAFNEFRVPQSVIDLCNTPISEEEKAAAKEEVDALLRGLTVSTNKEYKV